MEQQAYVDEFGQVIEKKDNRNKIIFICIAIIIVLVLAIIIVSSINGSKNKKCNKIEESLRKAVLSYAEDNNLLPSKLEESKNFEVSELIKKGYLKDYQMGEDVCDGSAKITRIQDDYVITLNVTDCGRCSTEERYGEWSTWSEKLPNKNIVDVEVTYNYVKKTINYSDWTSYYSPSELEEEPIESYKDDRFKTTISKDAKNIEIVSEELTYYRYRDKEWKFYRNNVKYSDFSSTQPSGYSKKDSSTAIQTEWTDWSTNSPDDYDYRQIEKKTGYRWYYEEGKEKVYYNGGQYLPTAPDSKYIERDKGDSATVYRYRDTKWRWYNGEARGYSGYMSTPTATYKYKDSDLMQYSRYSSWSTESKLDSSNKSYREEESEIRTRYRIKYDMYSYELLNESLTKDVFEKTVGMTVEEVENNNNYALIINYKYRYKK